LPKGNPSHTESPKLTVQEVVFRRGGPFPPARLSHRFISFLLDFLLLGTLSFLLLFRIILPATHPLELDSFEEWVEEAYEEQSTTSGKGQISTPALDSLSPEVWKMLVFSQNVMVFLFWIYFAACDTFFQGRTLGKLTFKLKVIHMQTLAPPDLPSAFIRATVKTICLFTLFPVALISFILVFFLNFQRAGHDYISKTIVVEDNSASRTESA